MLAVVITTTELNIKLNAGQAIINWEESGEIHSARWRSEAGVLPHRRVIIADDTMNADSAYRLASEGTALLWRGDFQNARQLLQALSRRLDHKPKRAKRRAHKSDVTPAEAFHLYRLAQSQRARTLGMLLLPLDTDYTIPLRRAPDVKQACMEAYGPSKEPAVVSLREVLGLIGAHEWRKKGVAIPALGERIHPHYGVFSPVRGEYVDLIAKAPLPSLELAFDIGTGTGVLAAVLAKRGVKRVVATDQDAKALLCARENIARLHLTDKIEIKEANLFPESKAPLIVCNPPWIPARPSSKLEHAIYDPDSQMLRGYLGGLAEHLAVEGEGWLILSNLAEHLGLRSHEELLAMISSARLEVIDKIDVKPKHPKTTDTSDPLHAARIQEITSLWRLKPK